MEKLRHWRLTRRVDPQKASTILRRLSRIRMKRVGIVLDDRDPTFQKGY
jgi:hypothetical protein